MSVVRKRREGKRKGKETDMAVSSKIQTNDRVIIGFSFHQDFVKNKYNSVVQNRRMGLSVIVVRSRCWVSSVQIRFQQFSKPSSPPSLQLFVLTNLHLLLQPNLSFLYSSRIPGFSVPFPYPRLNS